jgi:hypothetical protein
MPRKDTIRARDLERRAWQLRLKGWSLQRIADRLGVDRSTIGKALKRIDQRVLERLTRRAAREKVVQSERLEYLLAEATAAWHRSKEPTKSQTRRTVTGGGSKGSEQVA